MSTLSGLSSHIDYEGELLQKLNDAVLCVQASALGDLGLLGLSQSDVSKASSILLEFLEKLQKALKASSNDPTISMLVENIRHESEKTIEDWESDIEELIKSIMHCFAERKYGPALNRNLQNKSKFILQRTFIKSVNLGIR